MLKKNEIIVICGLFFVAMALILGFKIGSNTDAVGLKLVVTSDHEVVFEVPLSENIEKTIETPEGTNTVVVESGKAYVRWADCPNQICVHSPKISQIGETISCLPHKLLLTIEKGKDHEQ